MGRSLLDQFSAKAVFLVALLLSHEVLAIRDEIAARTNVMGRFDEAGLAEAGDVWSELGRAAATEDTEARCSDQSQKLFEDAYDSIATQMIGLSASCEDAKASGLSKCMGKSSGQSVVLTVRRAKRFQEAASHFRLCDWAPEVAVAREKLNKELAHSLDSIYENAPELKTLREKYPDVSFRGFIEQVQSSEGSQEDAERNIMGAVRKLFGSSLPADVDTNTMMKSMKKAEEAELLQTVSATKETPELLQSLDSGDAKQTIDDFVDLQPLFCWRHKSGVWKPSGCGSKSSCLRFTTLDYDSENATNKTAHPESGEHSPDRVTSLELVRVPSQTNGKKFRSTGGFLKTSMNTWGICAPYKGTENHIKELKDNRAKMAKLDDAGDVQDGPGKLVSLLQRTQTGAISQQAIIGILLQIPAGIAMFALVIVLLCVCLPLALVGLVWAGITWPLTLLGKVGGVLRWILFLPLCIVGVIVGIPFMIAFVLLEAIWNIGSVLLGAPALSRGEASASSASTCSIGWHMDR